MRMVPISWIAVLVLKTRTPPATSLTYPAYRWSNWVNAGAIGKVDLLNMSAPTAQGPVL